MTSRGVGLAHLVRTTSPLLGESQRARQSLPVQGPKHANRSFAGARQRKLRNCRLKHSAKRSKASTALCFKDRKYASKGKHAWKIEITLVFD